MSDDLLFDQWIESPTDLTYGEWLEWHEANRSHVALMRETNVVIYDDIAARYFQLFANHTPTTADRMSVPRPRGGLLTSLLGPLGL